MTSKTRDDRLTKSDSNGKGIANDRYSKSESDHPQVSSPKNKGPSSAKHAHDTRDTQSSASNKGVKVSGDPEGHSEAARKSKL